MNGSALMPTATHSHKAQSAFAVSRMLSGIAIGGLVAGAALMLAPSVLPAMGIGDKGAVAVAEWLTHSATDGAGLAGGINSILGNIPFIGKELAAGGTFALGATALTGIGGALLGRFIEHRQGAEAKVNWGKIIRFGALATSALVALPTILTAISTGLIFLSTFANNPSFSNSVGEVMNNTLGSMGPDKGLSILGLTGAAAIIPHLLSCGISLLPAALSVKLFGDHHKHQQEVKFAEREQERRAALEKAPKLHNDGDVEMEIKTPGMLKAGVECEAKVILRNAATHAPVTSEELVVSHTKKLHMFVVDKSLQDYQHLHPEPTNVPGEYVCRFTPKTDYNYNAWADFTTTDGKNHKLKRELECASGKKIAPRIIVSDRTEEGGMQVQMQLSDPLQKNEASIADFTLTDTQGKPIQDLEPVMGAYAHLVGFPADGKSLIHCHPLGAEPTNDTQRGGPKLRFHIEPETSGPTQFYLQVQRGGQDIMIPFGQRIKAQEKSAERIATTRLTPAPSHHGHHM